MIFTLFVPARFTSKKRHGIKGSEHEGGYEMRGRTAAADPERSGWLEVIRQSFLSKAERSSSNLSDMPI